MWRTDSFEKTLMLGKIEEGRRGDRGWDGWKASPTQWTWVWVNSRSWWWTGRPGMLQSMGSQRVRHDWATELNWKKCLLKTKKSMLHKMTETCIECEKVWRQERWFVISGIQLEGCIGFQLAAMQEGGEELDRHSRPTKGSEKTLRGDPY